MGSTPAEFRELSFRTYDDLSAELDRLEAAHRADALKHCGNWTAGQIFEHLATVIVGSYDGFGFKVPAPLALMGRAFRSLILSRGLKPGITLPPSAASFLPDPSITFETGLGNLRRQIARIQAGERMTQSSPVFGKIGHERWKALHLDHCAMHMGFLYVANEKTPA